MKKVLLFLVVLCVLATGIIIPYSNSFEVKAGAPILRQKKVVFSKVKNGYDYYNISIKNTGTASTQPFKYWFTVNNSWNVYPENPNQTNPIVPGATITFYCYVTKGTSVTSIEMSSDLYYIWPDKINL